MASMIQDLITVLSNEQLQYDNLVKYAALKKDCLIKNNVKELNDITNKEQIIMTEIKRYERKRKDVMENLRIVLNQNGMTLSSIADRLKDEDRGALLKIRDNLVNTVEQLKILNTQNAELINEGLKYTEYTMNAIKGPSREDNSYANELNYGRGNTQVRYFDYKR